MRALATHIRAFSILATLLLAACFTPARRPAPPVVVSQLAPAGFPATVRFLGIDRDIFLARADEIERRLRAAAGGDPVNILALSGGGAGGAFGAGALVGLTRRGDRPHFHVVTGVSAGALIAPFAFLGPDWDAELTDAFGSDRAAHLLRSRGPALLFRPGVYREKPLLELVNHFVTDRLVSAVAEQAARGGALLVATTDLDKQEPVIWDLGAIAMHGGAAARTLFRDVLVASASIPGLFPPVLIRVEGAGGPYDEMHVDGGTTLPFFVAAEIAQIIPREFEVLRGARVFVLVNGQLNSRPQTTRESPIAVLSRSFSAGLLQSSRKQLELSAAFAQRHAMQLRFSYIPASYPFQGPFGFKPPAMRELFTYAARCAAAGRLWLSLDQAVDQEARAATTPRKESDACPVATEAASPEH
jgi:predicted acylesterase/phospholipase RssA